MKNISSKHKIILARTDNEYLVCKKFHDFDIKQINKYFKITITYSKATIRMEFKINILRYKNQKQLITDVSGYGQIAWNNKIYIPISKVLVL